MARKRKKQNSGRADERNNFQDAAEKREYDKGKRAGEQQDAKQGRRGGNWRDSRFKGSNNFQTRGASYSAPIVGTKEGNDITWHNPNQSMFDDATGLTFNTATGLPIPIDPGGANAVSGWSGTTVPSPGIFVFHWAPSMGLASNEQSPLNQANTMLFQYLRRDKSGKETYQPADIGMIIGAVDSAYMFYEFCCKVYGLAQDIDYFNMYVPHAMLQAHSVNYKSVTSQLADFHYWLANFARRLRGLYVPKGIHLFDRHIYMTRQVFTDSETNKAQYYAYVPTHYLVFNETLEPVMSKLEYSMLINPATMGSQSPVSNLLTVQNLMDFGETLLLPLENSRSVRMVLADILTAFPNNGAYSIGDIPLDYKVKPIYDRQALMMFENSFTYGYTHTLEGGYSQKININTSYAVSTLTLTPNAETTPIPPGNALTKIWNAVQRYRNILNFHWDNPSKEDIMYATRLVGYGFSGPSDDDGTGLDSQLLLSHGSEIGLDYTIWYNEPAINPQLPVPALTSFTKSSYDFIRIANVAEDQSAATIAYASFDVMTTLMRQLSILSMFDWHPKIYPIHYIQEEGKATDLQVDPPLFDLDVYATMTVDQLEQLNRVSLIGLLVCRDMGHYSAQMES